MRERLGQQVPKEAALILEPGQDGTGIRPEHTSVIGTIQGDVHDIGKNLVGMLNPYACHEAERGAPEGRSPLDRARASEHRDRRREVWTRGPHNRPPGPRRATGETTRELRPREADLMRRVTTRALVAGGMLAIVAGGTFARARLMGRGPAVPKPVTGIFPNGMAYLRWGTGPRSLLWIPGGPGSFVPTSWLPLRMGQSWMRPFVEQGYTVWWVTRKQDMPAGHSFADMADDYGQLIADELDGKVDLVVGMSTGGQIGFYLAARHPDRFGHILILVAGYEDSERGKAILVSMARLLSQGRTGEAMAAMLEDMYPGLPRGVGRVVGAVMGRLMYGETHASFRRDVMVEAEAELACDAREVLPDITVPVLLVCGDQDPYFSKEVYEETARLIPDCTLRMYEGIGHEGVVSDKRFLRDVLDFVRQQPAAQPGRDAEQPASIDQPAAATDPLATPTPSPVGASRG